MPAGVRQCGLNSPTKTVAYRFACKWVGCISYDLFTLFASSRPPIPAPVVNGAPSNA